MSGPKSEIIKLQKDFFIVNMLLIKVLAKLIFVEPFYKNNYIPIQIYFNKKKLKLKFPLRL